MNGAVFDMDGLLIDTERVFLRCFSDTGYEMGYDDVEQVCLLSIGVNSIGTRRIFKQHYGESFSYDELRNRAAIKIGEFYEKNGVPVKSGVLKILELLKRNGFKLAVATSTDCENAKDKLKKSGLYDYFDEFVFGDEVKNGKPQPDIFLLACDKIGLYPSECYAFEDSINGVKSASAAGLKVFMIPDLLKPDDDIKKLAYMVSDSLDNAAEIIEMEIKNE